MARRKKRDWVYVQVNGYQYRVNPKHLKQVLHTLGE